MLAFVQFSGLIQLFVEIRGSIFSQFENELVPSWERGIWEKHLELVPCWE